MTNGTLLEGAHAGIAVRLGALEAELDVVDPRWRRDARRLDGERPLASAEVVQVEQPAGVPVAAGSVAELAGMVRVAGAVELAERLERALDDCVSLLALTIDERTIILATLEDPPDELTELRAVFLNEHEWRQREGLDP